LPRCQISTPSHSMLTPALRLGIITVVVGGLGLLLCVDFPEKWSSRWFSVDEMRYLKLRVKYRDGPVPPDMTFRWSVFLEAIKDWKTYLVASLLAFGGSVPTYSVNYTLATVGSLFSARATYKKTSANTLSWYTDGQESRLQFYPGSGYELATLCVCLFLRRRHCILL
jgi:hypothetical protein